jgi:large subunit ribosomal protein L24
MAKIKTPVRKNDIVVVRNGKDRGKRGRVLRVMADENRLIVEGVNIIKRHTRPNPQKNIKGGIVEKEATIHISNVAIVCKNCKKHTRIGNKILADGRTARTCKKCGNTIE